MPVVNRQPAGGACPYVHSRLVRRLLPRLAAARRLRSAALPDGARQNLPARPTGNQVTEEVETRYHGKPKFVRLIANHITGMTNSFTLKEYERLFLPFADAEGGVVPAPVEHVNCAGGRS